MSVTLDSGDRSRKSNARTLLQIPRGQARRLICTKARHFTGQAAAAKQTAISKGRQAGTWMTQDGGAATDKLSHLILSLRSPQGGCLSPHFPLQSLGFHILCPISPPEEERAVLAVKQCCCWPRTVLSWWSRHSLLGRHGRVDDRTTRTIFRTSFFNPLSWC